jgi:hypothetical protein
MVVAASCCGCACHRQGLGILGGDKKKQNTAISTGKIPEKNLVQSAFHQTLGDEFTFQQDNSLKHKAKSILEVLTKTTLNGPKWSSYSFYLNRITESMARLENVCLAMINNQLDRA